MICKIDAVQILEVPQFTVCDVCKITGATPKAIEHFLRPSRGLVRLTSDHVHPGTGKRRIFTGKQVLMIAASYAMNRIGFPQRCGNEMTEIVARRAMDRSIGLIDGTEMTLLTYPLASGDWAMSVVYRETDKPSSLPVAIQSFDVDRFIDDTLAQLTELGIGQDSK